MPDWNLLSETQKEVLYRLQDDEVVPCCFFKSVPSGVWKVLEQEGFIEMLLQPVRDSVTLQPVPNWRENGQYRLVARRIIPIPVGEPDISKEDLTVLKNLCDKYGKKRIARLAECQAWIGREKDDERRAFWKRIMQATSKD